MRSANEDKIIKLKDGGSPSVGLVGGNGDAKFNKPAPGMVSEKPKNPEMKSGGKVNESAMQKKFLKADAKIDKKQDKALEKKIEKKDDKDDARTMRKHEAKESEPKMKKGGNVKDHPYGKKAHHYADGGSVSSFGCMPKMLSSMGKVNKEKDE